MLIATIRHRLHASVPEHVIATEFCKVEFAGDGEISMTYKWNTVRSERCKEAAPQLEAAQKELNDCNKELNAIKISKPWWRPWYTKDEKKRKVEKDALYERMLYLFGENEKVKASVQDYTVPELYDRLQTFLVKEGFRAEHKIQSDKQVMTEIWIKGDD